jgi:hypothetical protein
MPDDIFTKPKGHFLTFEGNISVAWTLNLISFYIPLITDQGNNANIHFPSKLFVKNSEKT